MRHVGLGRWHLTIWHTPRDRQRSVPVYGFFREPPEEILGVSWGHGGASLWRR